MRRMIQYKETISTFNVAKDPSCPVCQLPTSERIIPSEEVNIDNENKQQHQRLDNQPIISQPVQHVTQIWIISSTTMEVFNQIHQRWNRKAKYDNAHIFPIL